MLPHVAAQGLTTHAVWTDDRFGDPDVVLMTVNPDSDGDGRTNLEEFEAGTDPRVPD